MSKEGFVLAIMEQMTGKVMTFPGFVVRHYNRLSIKLTIEEARSLDAVKLEETIDKDKIKAIYNSGQPIEGVSEIHYIQISSTERELK